MTEMAQRNGPKARTHRPSETPLENAFATWNPMLSGMQEWSHRVAEATATMQEEWLRFVEKRMREDMAFPGTLAQCKTPDEFMKVYSDFVATAIHDYGQQATMVARMSTPAKLMTAGMPEATYKSRQTGLRVATTNGDR